MQLTITLIPLIGLCTVQSRPNNDATPPVLSAGTFKRQAQEALSMAMADFTQSIYLHMVENSKEDNFVFSPLSLHSALSMLYLGTTNGSQTEQELALAMGIINNREMLTTGYKSVVDTYKTEKQFLYGNNFWIQDGFTVNPTFKEIIKNNMASGIENIDFTQTESVKTVNDWVSSLTGGKIKKLVESFSSSTALFMANALYFKEDWLVPFEDMNQVTDAPVQGDFFLQSGKRVNVPMIQQINPSATYGEIEVYNNQLVEVVSMPYKNDLFEMHIIVPKSNNGLHLMENKMKESVKRDLLPDALNFFNVFSHPKNESFEGEYIEEIYMKMPVFEIRSDLDAVGPLQELGAREVFNAGAELGGVASGYGPLTVSKISHTAVVEVTKKGTEGAAATGAEIVLLSAAPGAQKDVVVDRPFLFVVQDKKNMIPVLVGRVRNPTTKIP